MEFKAWVHETSDMDLVELMQLSKENPQIATIETTVTTGFECVAFVECREKLGMVAICKDRGRIYFNIDVSQIPLVHTMRSIDNIYVVANVIPNVGFPNSGMKEDLESIAKQVNRPNWKKMLAIWKDNESFQGICYPTSEEYLAALKIEQMLKEKARIEVELSGKANNESATSSADDTGLEKKLDAIELDKDRCDDLASPKPSTKPTPIGPLTRKQWELQVAREKTIVAKAYRKLDTRAPAERVLKYRVTCYRSGIHTFGSQDAACCFGGELQDKYQWIVDLELYDMEIVLSIKQEQLCVSIALTKESKHRRNIIHFGPTTLRSTVCYCLLALAEPRVGDIIIDPMCGGGSIPIEGMLAWPGVFFIGGEIHPKAVARSCANVNDLIVKKKQFIDLASWDATNLPLRTSSVDIVAIDLPFGRRSGSKKDNRVLYREVLMELARVIRKPYGKVVLLTEDRRSFKRVLIELYPFWKLIKTFGVNIGGLDAAVYVVKRRRPKLEVDDPLIVIF